MTKYPMYFCAASEATSEITASWDVHASEYKSSCAIPPEFSGPGGAPSPEDFFLMALSNCFVATFKVYAAASKCNFSSIRVEGKLMLDKGESNVISATGAELFVHLNGVEQPSRAQTLLQKVARSGILLNSVKTNLKFEYYVNGEKIAC